MWLYRYFALLLLLLSHSSESAPRIISLSPGTTELVASAGGLPYLIGVDSASDYPQSVKALPKVASYNALNIEKIIQLKPNLIVVWAGGNRQKDIEKLIALSQPLHFKLISINANTISDIPKKIKELEDIIHAKPYHNSIENKLKEKIQSVKTEYSHLAKVRVFYQIWHHPLMTISQQQFIGQAIELCGGQNIFADLNGLASEVGIEGVVSRNPQVILLGGESALQKSWQNDWQKWTEISAVKHQQIVSLSADALQRPTARLIDYLPELCQTLDKSRQYYKNLH